MADDVNAPTVPDTRGPVDPASSSGAPGAPDPRYGLRTLLGKGGMGEVWLAHDERVDREIALKLMRGGTQSPDGVTRFLREALVQSRLEHPSVVPVHDLGRDERSPYFAMKRLAGVTLADVIAARDDAKWPRRTLLARFVDVCLAIEFAHQRGVVHRDLKPANIMLGDFGEAYVLDWGIARLTGDTDAGDAKLVPDSVPRSGGSTPAHTEAGTMLGTPGYMPPEQMRGEPVDVRADVYALGCILFEILAGEPAIARDKAYEQTLSAHGHRPSTRVSDVPPELDDACAEATAADRANRPASARMLADRIQRFLDGDRDLERRRELAAESAARAKTVLARSGDDARAEAMREAGSAIALDPHNRDAQAVVAKLLLEPPAEMPALARERLERELHKHETLMMKSAFVVYMAFLVVTAVVWALGVSSNVGPAVMFGEVMVLSALCAIGARRQTRVGLPLLIAVLVLHCLLIATVAVCVGTFLLAPVLVFGSATIGLAASPIRLPRTIVISHTFAIGIPFALEVFEVIPRTFHFVNGGLVLTPGLVKLAPAGMLVAMLATVLLQLIGNALVVDGQRKAQRVAQERLHVQAWQLEQLVPRSGPAA